MDILPAYLVRVLPKLRTDLQLPEWFGRRNFPTLHIPGRLVFGHYVIPKDEGQYRIKGYELFASSTGTVVTLYGDRKLGGREIVERFDRANSREIERIAEGSLHLSFPDELERRVAADMDAIRYQRSTSDMLHEAATTAVRQSFKRA